MLPVSARTKIYAEAFQLQRGLGALESVMRGLFLDEEIGIPFMLSASAYDALRNSYTRHEQSLHAFQSTLQVSAFVRIIIVNFYLFSLGNDVQLLVLDHFGLPNSVFCGMDMLGEPDEAQAALRDPQSRLFLDNLRSTIADDVRRLPESPLSAWWTSRASQRSKSSKAADYDDLLQFLSTARTEFNDHHTRLQFAIRLLRRVALEARTHAAEMKAGLSSLLGSAVRGSIFRGELPLIKEKIQYVGLFALDA
ncbi:hypothetical protein DL93DRAFT_2083533 [Clavulina sp. PMI_390]|nr:hypothetical protein DL93DRAFT_2083533 [Clavulina sp. PMI_390]